jgi:hypothetical protein
MVDPSNRARARKGWHTLTKARLFPTSGGEPLWRVAGHLAIFASALHPTKECRNGRLPRITQREAFTCGFSIRSQ